ncbi:MAG TPA: hypothetical protein VE684_08225 [Crenalkalicoccus sp.]|nr:hypothetical protein [Crenalkalicoccus sp.]
MTDEPVPETPAEPEPSSLRARIEASRRRRLDLLPVLYLIGLLVLGGTLFFLYRHPPAVRLEAQDANRVQTLQSQVQGLREQVAELQSRPAPPAAPSADVTQLQQRMESLEKRPAASGPGPDMGALANRVQALENRPAPNLAPLTARIDALEQRKAVDLAPLEQRIAALERRPQVDLAPVTQRLDQLAAQTREATGRINQRLDALEQRVGQVEAQAKQTQASVDAIAQKALLASKLQGASAALAAGQKLGDIPGAPPALARFANEAPPTEASLRLSFEKYAEAAQRASQPAIMDNQDFGTRLWNRAQQVVTVRQGDRVLLGDPISGVIAHAREALDAGDLTGAVKALDGLAGPAAAAMKPWVDQARALLEARAAIASMAAG